MPLVPGQLTVDGLPSDYWNTAQRARWMAEDGVRRLEATLGEEYTSSRTAGRANMYAGFANRLLGENHCESVIDGGPPEPNRVYFDRAEEFFTRAVEIATNAGDEQTRQAAFAGRAAVRVFQGNWAGAMADAREVPVTFTFMANYTQDQLDQYNLVYYHNANQPFRVHSVVATYYEAYYTQSGDPRVSWKAVPGVPNAEYANVRWLPATKYKSVADDIRLVSGREMRLIEAEAALREGRLSEAITILNGLRSSLRSDHNGAPIAALQATTTDEGWTALKRERGIELWLEGRRLGDLRRWVEGDTPGAMENVADRIRLCLPIAQSERDSNRNVPTEHADPINPLFVN
jgi:hypothetical protein